MAVRLRRLNYPEEVRTAVFEQIRSERQRVAAATRAEGESQARMIRAPPTASAPPSSPRPSPTPPGSIGEGEAEAARIANEAQAADPAFYQFLKTLETYRAALDARTTLVLSADSRFLRLLTQGLPTRRPRPAKPDRRDRRRPGSRAHRSRGRGDRPAGAPQRRAAAVDRAAPRRAKP